MGFEFGQIQVQSVGFATSMALWIWASYLAPLNYSFLICEMRGGTPYRMQRGRSKQGSPCRALSWAPGAWCAVLMGVGGMEMTSTALGGGQTNEKEHMSPTPVSSGTGSVGGGGEVEGHKSPDLVYLKTEIGTDWRTMCRLCHWCAKGDDSALWRSWFGCPP